MTKISQFVLNKFFMPPIYKYCGLEKWKVFVSVISHFESGRIKHHFATYVV
jgi:hypothetical protein